MTTREERREDERRGNRERALAVAERKDREDERERDRNRDIDHDLRFGRFDPRLALEVIEFRLEQIENAIFPYRPEIIAHADHEAHEQVELLEQWFESQPPGRFRNTYPPFGGMRSDGKTYDGPDV